MTKPESQHMAMVSPREAVAFQVFPWFNGITLNVGNMQEYLHKPNSMQEPCHDVSPSEASQLQEILEVYNNPIYSK
jgi:hypothetical protein